MSDYTYIVGGLFGLAVFMLILGNMGAASDIYGDEFVVINSNTMEADEIPSSYDFDVDRIQFTPDFLQSSSDSYVSEGLKQSEIINGSEINFTESNRIYWTGIDNDLNQSNGYVNFNVTDRFDIIYLRFYDSGFFFRTVNTYITDENGTTREVVGGSPRAIDLSGRGDAEVFEPDEQGDGLSSGSYDDLGNIEVVKVEITDVESYVNIGNFASETDSGLIELGIIYIGNIIQSIRELGSMFLGYLYFAAQVPGLLGTVLRLYIGIVVSVVVVKEFWIG